MKPLLYVLFILNVFVVWYTHSTGKHFYHKRQNEGKTSQKIYDASMKYVKDLSNYTWISYFVTGAVLIAPLLLQTSMSSEYYEYFMVVVLVKYLLNAVMILPKQKRCDDSKLTLINFLKGHCYDNILSINFAASTLLGYVLYKNGSVSLVNIITANVVNALLLIATRTNYTIDLLVAFLVVTIVYQNKIRIPLKI